MKRDRIKSRYITRYCIIRNKDNNTLFDITGVDQYNLLHELRFMQGLELEKAMEITQDWNKQITDLKV